MSSSASVVISRVARQLEKSSGGDRSRSGGRRGKKSFDHHLASAVRESVQKWCIHASATLYSWSGGAKWICASARIRLIRIV